MPLMDEPLVTSVAGMFNLAYVLSYFGNQVDPIYEKLFKDRLGDVSFVTKEFSVNTG